MWSIPTHALRSVSLTLRWWEQSCCPLMILYCTETLKLHPDRSKNILLVPRTVIGVRMGSFFCYLVCTNSTPRIICCLLTPCQCLLFGVHRFADWMKNNVIAVRCSLFTILVSRWPSYICIFCFQITTIELNQPSSHKQMYELMDDRIQLPFLES